MSVALTTADWALVVSIFSLIISLAGFVWNVWSKFIFPKPQIRVSFYVARMIPDPGNIGRFLTLSATNQGPIECTLDSAVVRTFGGTGWGLLNPMESFPARTDFSNGPFSGGLPKKLAVGESFSVHFPFNPEGFLADDIRKIGFLDTFGRHHWAPRKAVKKVVATYEDVFGPVGVHSGRRSAGITE